MYNEHSKKYLYTKISLEDNKNEDIGGNLQEQGILPGGCLTVKN